MTHNLHQLYNGCQRCFWQHVQAPHGPHCVISGNDKTQIICKISDFEHPLSLRNGMLTYNEMRPLLLECSTTFVRCIRRGRRAYGSTSRPLWSTLCVISSQNGSHISCKISGFGHPLSTGHLMLCYKERRILRLECVMIFLRCMVVVGRSSDNIYETIMVHIMTFLPKPNLIFHSIYYILGTLLSTWGTGCFTAKRHIHCYLSVS